MKRSQPETETKNARRHRIALEAIRAMATCPSAAPPGALEWWCREAAHTAPAEPQDVRCAGARTASRRDTVDSEPVRQLGLGAGEGAEAMEDVGRPEGQPAM